MNACKEEGFTAKVMAVRLLCQGAMAATGCLCFSAAASADTGAFKTEVSHASVTTMPAYTVEEAQSAKTHTLFMGADIAINLDRDIYKVKDVWGSNWVIDVNGRDKEISARQAPLNLKITPGLKLTESSVTIQGFKRVQAYSYANDPSVRLTRGLNQSAVMNNDLTAVAQNAQNRVDAMTNKQFAQFAASDDQFSANAMMTTAQYAYSNSHPAGIDAGGFPKASPTAPTTTNIAYGGPTSPYDSSYINVGTAATAATSSARQAENGNEAVGKIATGGLDAMDVEFDIRSAKPLHNPYVVTMTRFRTTGGKAGMVQNLVYAKSINPIDEHLSHVHFVEEGFPFNYELLDFQLHIYNRGEEVATNIASDRVELTREEAFEYVKIEYIGAHAKDTLPAEAAMAKPPADLPAKLAHGQYGAAFYVKVSKDGMASEAYSDAGCSKRIDDPYLDSVVKRVRFKPALNNGKPVDGIATLKLSQLAI